MDSVRLDELLRRATPYERWRAPLDRRLRRTAVLSGVSILIVLVGLTALLVLGPSELPALFATLLVIDLVGAAVYVWLIVATDRLRTGRPCWHWVALGEVALGALNGLLLALALAGGLLFLVVTAIGGVFAPVGDRTLPAHLLPAGLAPLVVVTTITLIKVLAALFRG